MEDRYWGPEFDAAQLQAALAERNGDPAMRDGQVSAARRIDNEDELCR
jgi:hypothetical protein